jgi:hypothetical protein
LARLKNLRSSGIRFRPNTASHFLNISWSDIHYPTEKWLTGRMMKLSPALPHRSRNPILVLRENEGRRGGGRCWSRVKPSGGRFWLVLLRNGSTG